MSGRGKMGGGGNSTASYLMDKSLITREVGVIKVQFASQAYTCCIFFFSSYLIFSTC